MTTDLLVGQALRAEANSPTVIIDNDVLIDTIENPSSASRIGLLGVRTLFSELGGASAIYRDGYQKGTNPWPYMLVRKASGSQSRFPTQQSDMVQVVSLGAAEDGADVITRLSSLAKKLLHNNYFPKNNTGFEFICFTSEAGPRYQDNYGWWNSILFRVCYSVGSF